MTIYDLVEDLKNENEDVVIDTVYQYQMANRLPCTCRECILDVTALALNAIKPRYCVALLKELHVSEDERVKFANEVKQAIDKACEIVKARPHHFGNQVSTEESTDIKIDGEKMEFN